MIGILPHPLKLVVVEEKMDDPPQMPFILQLCFVKADQPQIPEFFLIKRGFGYHRDFPRAAALKLIPEQKLACAVTVIFFCHLCTSYWY